MNGILQRLFKKDNDIKIELKEQTALLNKIYSVQLDSHRAEEERERARRQREKRASADKGGPLATIMKKQEKEKEGIFQKILKGLGLVAGAIGTVLKPIFDTLFTKLSGLITPLLNSLLNKIGGVARPLASAGGKVALTTGALLAGGGALQSANRQIEGAATNQTMGEITTEKGTQVTAQNILDLRDESLRFMESLGMKSNNPKRFLEEYNKYGEVLEMMKVRKTLNDQLYRQEERKLSLQKDIQKFEGKTDVVSRSRVRDLKSQMSEVDGRINDLTTNLNIKTDQVRTGIKKLQVAESDITRATKKKEERGLFNRLGNWFNKTFKEEDMEDLKKFDFGKNVKTYEFDQKQMGGFVGMVPNQGGDGDRFAAMLQPGSVVLNQTAAGMMQSGGMVPTLLEQGEKVYSPSNPMAGHALMMNSMIPRFQTGGVVGAVGPEGDPIPQSEASGARTAPSASASKPTKKDAKKEAEAAEASKGKVGADAIIAAAEKSVGIYAGVGEMCARTTREVLQIAGHPQAKSTTNTADLDSPKGYGPSKTNPDLAGSFAGTDMGKVHDDPRSAPPGSVIMWRGTYGADKWGPEAVTHVGIKGKGSDMYHHGTSPGWRKAPLSSYMPDFAVDLNGQATGGGGGGKNMFEKFLDMAKGFGGIGEEYASVFSAAKDAFSSLGTGIAEAIFPGLASVTQDGGAGGDSSYGEQIGPPSTPGGAYGESSLVQALDKAGYKDKKERAMFLAQMAHESGNFKYDEEIASGAAYEGRSDLGNTQPGDGKKYKGRGYIQLTGRANYDYYGKMVGQDLVNNPELAKDPNIAADVAIAYWKDRKISAPARDGNINRVTKIINGGYNGLDDRKNKYQQYLAKGLQTGGVAQVKGGTTYGSDTVKKSQEQFAQMIASKMNPTVIPVPMGGGSGGGGGTRVVAPPGSQAAPPKLSSDDTSVVAMEYKYRITMGSTV